MKQICDSIKENTRRILQIVEDLVREQPWHNLPREHRLDGLPELVVGIVNASLCEPQDVDAHRQKILAAASHGEQLREQGSDENLLFAEYHLLRQAMWHYIREEFPARRAVEAITRIDTAITLATMASLRGYHAEELRASGQWAGRLEELTDESPLLGNPPGAGYDGRQFPLARIGSAPLPRRKTLPSGATMTMLRRITP